MPRTLLLLVALAGTAAIGTATAQQGTVDRLTVRVRSGEDDLRKGSQLRVWLLLRNGDALYPVPVRDATFYRPWPVNCSRSGYCSTIPSKTSRSYEVTLERAVLRAEIDRVVLGFNGGRETIFDTPDNWDLAELEVRARMNRANGRQEVVTLVRRQGSLLYRFRDSETHEWPVSDTTRARVRVTTP